jgi:hypothetical protein
MSRGSKIMKNLYVITTITTICFVIVFCIVKYLLGGELNPASIAGGAVVFWVVFYLANKYFRKRIEKKG